MLCQNCKKREATVSHTADIGGKLCSYHLCAFCADAMFSSFESSFAQGLDFGLLDDAEQEEKACPLCGMRFSEYQRKGLLGCPTCYDVFHTELMPYVAKIQGKVTHVGASGGVNTAKQDEMIRLTSLQKAMEEALARGDFAEAGRINGKIAAIKKTDGGSGEGWQW